MKISRLLCLFIFMSILIAITAMPGNGLNSLDSLGAWLNPEARLAQETPATPSPSISDHGIIPERLETPPTPVKIDPSLKIDDTPAATPSRSGSELATEIKQTIEAKSPAPLAPQTVLPAPQQAPTPSSTRQNVDAAQEMLGYINAARTQAGLPPLVLNSALCQGAYLKSKDMAENSYFSHTSPTYGDPFAMMKSQGIAYHYAGENIAKNVSIIGTHQAFMNSSGHRANIMNSDFGRIGLGFYWQGDYLYVTQWFAD
ncbi:MAG: CAP domain-containing protein [Syntrophomonadaceae bacterium]|jgi:uncharacterized protein YkwD